MAVQIKWRRDTAANWTSSNPVLAQGEPGFETDTGNYKIGDGTTAWTSLGYGSYSTNPLAALFGDQTGGDPSAPSSDKLLVYGKSVANRMMTRQIGPSGLATVIQPFLARNKVGYWIPPGNATTVPGVFGYTAPTAIGTATTANVDTTNMFTRMRRLSYVSATSTNAYCGQRVAVAQVSIGPGFFKIVRFGISDASPVSGSIMFVGVGTTTAAPTGGGSPATLKNIIGVGNASGDTSLSLYYAGSTSGTPINFGSSFPVNTTQTDVYEFALFSPPNDNNKVYYEVTRVNTGDVVTGMIDSGGSGILLPAPATLLTYAWHWRCNLTSGSAVSLDIMSDYIETDT